eukprot:1440449-Amphidinium_carterae.1
MPLARVVQPLQGAHAVTHEVATLAPYASIALEALSVELHHDTSSDHRMQYALAMPELSQAWEALVPTHQMPEVAVLGTADQAAVVMGTQVM